MRPGCGLYKGMDLRTFFDAREALPYVYKPLVVNSQVSCPFCGGSARGIRAVRLEPGADPVKTELMCPARALR